MFGKTKRNLFLFALSFLFTLTKLRCGNRCRSMLPGTARELVVPGKHRRRGKKSKVLLGFCAMDPGPEALPKRGRAGWQPACAPRGAEWLAVGGLCIGPGASSRNLQLVSGGLVR